MSLPQHTLDSFSHYLDLFLMSTRSSIEDFTGLQEKITETKKKIDSGSINELEFEHFINSLIIELDEHMFVWKIVAKARASQFLQRGASFLILVTAPDLKTCIPLAPLSNTMLFSINV